MVRAYPETTETGHHWLGRVPAHWRVSPLSVHFDERSQFVSDEEFPPLSVTKDGVVPQMANVAKTDNGGNRKLVRAGDFAINSRSDRKGSAGLSALDGSTSVVYTVLVPRPSIDGRFVHHMLRSQAFQEEFYRWGNGIVADLWSTRYSSMKRIPLAVPPLEEQRAIADYLDRETARIDTLIDEQQRLIEMLRERRQSVIAESFAAPATTPLRHTIEYAQTGPFGTQLTADEYIDGGVPVINPTHIQRGRIVPDDSTSVTREKADKLARYRLAVGDIVLGRKGEVDKSALVDAESDGYVCGSDAMALRPRPGTVPSYLWWFLQSPEAHGQLEFWSVGATVSGLNQTTIRKVRVPLPDEREQRRISTHLHEQTEKIDSMIVETQQFIGFSKERRSALITAAVTGQIDVREVA